MSGRACWLFFLLFVLGVLPALSGNSVLPPLAAERPSVSGWESSLSGLVYEYDNQDDYFEPDLKSEEAAFRPRAISSLQWFGSEHNLQVVSYGQQLPRQRLDNWMVWPLLIGLFLAGISRFFFSSRIHQFFQGMWGTHYFSMAEKDGGFFDEAVTYMLFVNFLLVFSLLLFVSFELYADFPLIDFLHDGLVFLLLLLLLTVYFLLKSTFTALAGWIFDVQSASGAYLKNIFLFNMLSGLVLLPMVAWLVYSPSETAVLIVWMAWGLLNLAKVLRGGVLGRQLSGISSYYLILYLCSVEIMPLLAMIKAADLYLLNP